MKVLPVSPLKPIFYSKINFEVTRTFSVTLYCWGVFEGRIDILFRDVVVGQSQPVVDECFLGYR